MSKNYYISFSARNIYVLNYLMVHDFSDSKIEIIFEGLKVVVRGRNFKITRKSKQEIEIMGDVEKSEFVYE